MDITAFILWALLIGFIVGMLCMYGIIEYHFDKETKRRNKSMLDFAEYCKRQNKRIDFDLFKDVGGSFDEK